MKSILCAIFALFLICSGATAQDVLPNVRGDGNSNVESRPQILIAEDGTLYNAPQRGELSVDNSTQDLLTADEEWSGEWEVNSFDWLFINAVSDVDGAIYIDFGIVKDGVDPTGSLTDSDIIATTTLERRLVDGESRVVPLAKAAGRAVRVRYINGDTDQANFGLLTSYGASVFPIASTEDNEIAVTTTEQERGVWAIVGETEVTTTDIWRMLIDVSDTTNWPHSRTGRVDLTNEYIRVGRDANATGVVVLYLVLDIDGTEATLAPVSAVTFNKSDERQITADRKYSPDQLKLAVVDGEALYIAVDGLTTTTDINTGVTVDGPDGLNGGAGVSTTPAVGDVLVLFAASASGAYEASVKVSYHGERYVQ